jgi:hypothetical protein
MSSDEEVREEKELDLSSNEVVTKYKTAAEIINSNLSPPRTISPRTISFPAR